MESGENKTAAKKYSDRKSPTAVCYVPVGPTTYGVKNVSKMVLVMISCGRVNVRLAIVDVDVPGGRIEDDLGNGLEESPVVGKKWTCEGNHGGGVL